MIKLFFTAIYTYMWENKIVKHELNVVTCACNPCTEVAKIGGLPQSEADQGYTESSRASSTTKQDLVSKLKIKSELY